MVGVLEGPKLLQELFMSSLRPFQDTHHGESREFSHLRGERCASAKTPLHPRTCKPSSLLGLNTEQGLQRLVGAEPVGGAKNQIIKRNANGMQDVSHNPQGVPRPVWIVVTTPLPLRPDRDLLRAFRVHDSGWPLGLFHPPLGIRLRIGPGLCSNHECKDEKSPGEELARSVPH